MSSTTGRADQGSRVSPLARGRAGEDRAVEYLRSQGLVVLSRNWRCREGELDVVATDGNTLIVCEVKTRSGPEYGAPEEAVTRDKQARIRRLTHRWLAAYRVAWCPIRFDVVAIDDFHGDRPKLRHFRGAF